VWNAQVGSASGHVFRVSRKSGPVWYAKFRLGDGRQVQKRIGPAWCSRGRPEPGFFGKREAEAWLAEVLSEARRGLVVRTDVLFDEAAREWLRYAEEDRACKPTTLRDYKNSIERRMLPWFGGMALEKVTPQMIVSWRASLPGGARTKNKQMTILNGIMRRACRMYGLPTNPVSGVERLREVKKLDLEVLEPEEVWALVRAAASEQDAAIYLTAAFTGMRMGELRALRWRDVDFPRSIIRVRASYSMQWLTTPKSGKVRAVPLAPDVAAALARMSARTHCTGDQDLVFPGQKGGFLDDSALRRRYKVALAAAGLRQLRFHDLRHTFGTRMIGKADILRVKEWMGHADVTTTMRYLHYRPRPQDAALVAEAFAVPAGDGTQPGALTRAGRGPGQ
jgi:integrase